MSDTLENSRVAPWYRVPDTPVLSIEHPCIVHNVGKAIHMLGGPREVAQSLEADNDKPLGLKFQPDDPASRTVVSYNKKTNNVLLKVTVPKRTGRKRKRGSNGPFVDHHTEASPSNDVKHLLRSLRDNPQNYQTEVVGTINSTHIWRAMPDYVYSSQGSSFLNDVRSKILPQEYPLLKQWFLPGTYGLTDTETIPPPVFSTQGVPTNYTYRQNPAVKTIADPRTGKQILHNTQAPLKLFTIQCAHDDITWPDKPPADCPLVATLSESEQTLYRVMHRLFEERPIWTRRALVNHFPDDAPLFLVRGLIAYVAFAIRSGPWRDTLCRYGVDPRSDRSYRKYQSIFIQLLPRDREKNDNAEDFARSWRRTKDKNSHIFKGIGSIPPDGKVWQLCDMEDPQLKSLVDVPDLYIRHECETRYFGWYSNGTMAKIRVALKAKVDASINSEAFDEAAMEKFLRLPEMWDHRATNLDGRSNNPLGPYLPKDASKKEQEWTSAYRSLCRTQGGNLPQAGGSGKGRLGKTKLSTRSSFIDSEGSRVGTAAEYEEPDEGEDDFKGAAEDEEEEDDEVDNDVLLHDGTESIDASNEGEP